MVAFRLLVCVCVCAESSEVVQIAGVAVAIPWCGMSPNSSVYRAIRSWASQDKLSCSPYQPHPPGVECAPPPAYTVEFAVGPLRGSSLSGLQSSSSRSVVYAQALRYHSGFLLSSCRSVLYAQVLRYLSGPLSSFSHCVVYAQFLRYLLGFSHHRAALQHMPRFCDTILGFCLPRAALYYMTSFSDTFLGFCAKL